MILPKQSFSEEGRKGARFPSIVADAAYAILSRNAREATGNFYLDDDILKAEGVTDFNQYAVDPSKIYIHRQLGHLIHPTFRS